MKSLFTKAALSIASGISLEAVVWSILLIYLFRLTVMSFATIKVFQLTWKEFLRPVLAGGFMGIVIFITWILMHIFTARNSLAAANNPDPLYHQLSGLGRGFLVRPYPIIGGCLTERSLQPHH